MEPDTIDVRDVMRFFRFFYGNREGLEIKESRTAVIAVTETVNAMLSMDLVTTQHDTRLVIDYVQTAGGALPSLYGTVY